MLGDIHTLSECDIYGAKKQLQSKKTYKQIKISVIMGMN